MLNLQSGPNQELHTILSVDPCLRLPLPITIHYTFNYWPLGGKDYQVRDYLGGRNFKALLTKLAQNLKLMASLQVVVASSNTTYLTPRKWSYMVHYQVIQNFPKLGGPYSYYWSTGSFSIRNSQMKIQEVFFHLCKVVLINYWSFLNDSQITWYKYIWLY